MQNLNIIFNLLGSIVGMLTPFIIGLCIAFIVNIPMRFLETKLSLLAERRKHKRIWMGICRPVSLLISILLVMLILTIFVLLIAPEIQETILLIIDRLPAQIDKVVDSIGLWVKQYQLEIPNLDWSSLDWSSIGIGLLKSVTDNSATVIDSTLSVTTSVLGNAFNFLLGFVFAIYILLAKGRLAVQVKKIAYALLPEQAAKRIFYISGVSNHIFSKFVIGQCTEAVILGVLCYLGMSILSLPYAMMISSLVAITALIPVFGAFIGTGIGMFLIFFQSPMQALWFLIFMLVLQQLEGNIIYPKVVGESVGLPGIWVLFAVTIGGTQFGAIGMLISVPVCAVCYCLIREGVEVLLKKKQVRKSLYE